MTPDETTLLLAKMAVVWPKAHVEQTTIMLWQNNLANIRRPDLADVAVAALMESTPFWPHWSEFMGAYRDAMSADRRDVQGFVRALPAPVPSGRVDPAAEFAKMRQILAECAPKR